MMKRIDDIVNNLSHKREEHEQKPLLCPLATKLVENIFAKMALLCRGFDSFYADRQRLNAEKTQWILAFSKKGIKTKSQINLALAKLECYKFPNPPQLGEFLDWMKSSIKDLGFPEIQEAFYIANRINMQFSDYVHEDERVNRVIKHAINQMGATRLREMKIDLALKAFESYYRVSLNQYLEGKLEKIQEMLNDKSIETRELSKQEKIATGFEQLNSYDKSMAWMKKMLGMELNAN